jgi:parallel beta-helix repeat protein
VPECTLRAALQEANGLAGSDDIVFNIFGSNLTIKPASALPNITGALDIDARTQPGYAGLPLVELDGSSAGLVDGLRVTGDDVTIAGLVVNRFGEDGIALVGAMDVDVEDNFIGTTASGAGDAGNGQNGVTVNDVEDAKVKDNVISGNGVFGVEIMGGSTLVSVVGNLIGTNAAGTSAIGNGFEGVEIFRSPNNTVGGGAGGKNIISGNGIIGSASDGVEIFGAESTGNVIKDNYIGLNAAGTGMIPNRDDGLTIDSASNNTIDDNTISGNEDDGILVHTLEGGTATGNLLIGNDIGVDKAGKALPNGDVTRKIGDGIEIRGVSGNRIEGNKIKDNGGHGIFVAGAIGTPVSRNTLTMNEVADNGRLGINLGEDQVTLNDAGDADLGDNGLQNFPEVTSALSNSIDLRVSGQLSSAPSQTYRVELFALGSNDCDDTGYGEGDDYIGFVDVTTDGSGVGLFTATFAGAEVNAGKIITATATDAQGNTSEFSKCDENNEIASGDADKDGLWNEDEVALGTDPNDGDTDNDLISDGPLDPDGSKAIKLWEKGADTAPLDPCAPNKNAAACPDDDYDGVLDKPDPNDTDPCIPNAQSLACIDTDGDGVKDRFDSGPTDVCLPNAGFPACDQEPDGLTNTQEAALGTDGTKADTDGDGLGDKEESEGSTSPTKADTDGDGVNDKVELDAGTNPLDEDTDNDGLNDKVELEDGNDGTNPNDADSDDDGVNDKNDPCYLRCVITSGGTTEVSGQPLRLEGTGEAIEILGNNNKIQITDTYAGKLTVTGKGNSIVGSDRSDDISILGCANTVRGGAGNDTIEALCGTSATKGKARGPAGNVLMGDAGSDELTENGKTGARLIGGAGTDVLQGSSGNDVLIGGDSMDTLIGGGGADKLYGQDGPDTLRTPRLRRTLATKISVLMVGGNGGDTCLGTGTKKTCEVTRFSN